MSKQGALAKFARRLVRRTQPVRSRLAVIARATARLSERTALAVSALPRHRSATRSLDEVRSRAAFAISVDAADDIEIIEIDGSVASLREADRRARASRAKYVGVRAFACEPLNDAWAERLAVELREGVKGATAVLVHPVRAQIGRASCRERVYVLV